MPKRSAPPARRRYEAAHPTVTARVPAAVKTTLHARLAADGLTFSEWVQAQVAQATPDLTAAYERGRQAGQAAGETAGYARGQADGVRQGRAAAFRAGILASELLHAEGGHYDAGTVAGHVLAQPGQRAIVEALLPEEVNRAWRRLVRRVEPTTHRGGGGR